jgi:hypothetical protein
MSDPAVVDGDWEYQPMRLPRGMSRPNAATVLAVQAEFAGWELSNVRLYSDGSRQVTLRRKRGGSSLPGLSI